MNFKSFYFIPLLWIILSNVSCVNTSGDGFEERKAVSQLDTALEVCSQYHSISTDTFEKYSKLAVALAEKAGTGVQLELARLHLATYYFNVAEFDSAMHQCALVEERLVPEKDTLFLLNKTAILRGSVLLKQGKTQEALDWFFEVLPAIEAKGKMEDVYRINNNIGVCYVNMLRHEDAIRWYKKNTIIPDNSTYPLIKAAACLNVADGYAILGVVDSATRYADMALNISSEHNLLLIKANTLNAMAKILNLEGKIDESIEKVLQAVELRKELGDPYYVVSDLLQLSYMYKNKAWFDKGIQTASEALAIAQKHEMITQYYSIASVLWENYYHSGRYKEAGEQVFELMNEMFRINRDAVSEAMAEMEVKYETDKKEQLIKEQELELERKNILLYGSMILLGLLVIIIYFAYVNYKNRKDRQMKNAIIKEQQLAARGVIHGQEQERSQISQHLHDGVGQTLSGLKMNLQALNELVKEDPEKKDIMLNSLNLLDGAIEEIRNIAHQIIPNNIMRLGLVTALEMMIKTINNNVLKIKMEADVQTGQIDNDVQLMVYRVIQESINNVIKHAKAHNLYISMNMKDERLYVMVIDDGLGFDTSELPNNSGIGLNNIYTRVRFLKGSITIKSAFNQGTQISFDVPSKIG